MRLRTRIAAIVLSIGLLAVFFLAPILPYNYPCPGGAKCFWAPLKVSPSYYLFGFGGYMNDYGNYGFALSLLGLALMF